MNIWVSRIVGYLNKFLELGVLLLAVSVIAEILFGPNVAFFGSHVTSNLINLLNSNFKLIYMNMKIERLKNILNSEVSYCV